MNLIYYVCFGEKYKKYTAMSIWSLVNIGKYEGDIFVLGDICEFDNKYGINDKVTFFNIKDDIQRLMNIDEKTSVISHFQNTKALLQFYTNINDYEFVLYLDSDVLINTSKINEMINSYSKGDKIVIQSDRSTIGGKRGINCGFNLFTEEEIKRYGHIGLCSGVVGFPVKKFGVNFLNLWNSKNKELGYSNSDQGNLHWVIAKFYEKDFKYIEDTKVHRSIDKSDTTILHFFRKRLSNMDVYFEKHLNGPI